MLVLLHVVSGLREGNNCLSFVPRGICVTRPCALHSFIYVFSLFSYGSHEVPVRSVKIWPTLLNPSPKKAVVPGRSLAFS